MNRLKWFRRTMGILVLLGMLAVLAWFFLPVRQPTEKQLLSLVPADATAVIVQHDLVRRGHELENSRFIKACCESTLMPMQFGGDSRAQRAGRQALLDLLGDRFVVFLVPGANRETVGGACVLAPITWRSKWVWVRAMLIQYLRAGGFHVRDNQIDGHLIHEIQTQSPLRLRYAMRDGVLALACDRSGDSLAALFRAPASQPSFPLPLPQNDTESLQLGSWRQPVGTSTWRLSTPGHGTFRFDLTVPKQRSVRQPWDATRNERTMGLIQKMFPDPGVLASRGRASHWMAAWDNLVAWLGMSPDMFCENLLARTKYQEHLSHGQFPWSGAGDEFALLIAPSENNAPNPLPTITLALRCWETNDTQVAAEQFLPSLASASGARFRLAPSASDQPGFTVWMETAQNSRPLFSYRYVDGLVIASTSTESLWKFDVSKFEGQTLETRQPENELECRAEQLAAALEALDAVNQIAGNDFADANLKSVAHILKTLAELRLTIQVDEKEVRYRCEIREL